MVNFDECCWAVVRAAVLLVVQAFRIDVRAVRKAQAAAPKRRRVVRFCFTTLRNVLYRQVSVLEEKGAQQARHLECPSNIRPPARLCMFSAFADHTSCSCNEQGRGWGQDARNPPQQAALLPKVNETPHGGLNKPRSRQ